MTDFSSDFPDDELMNALGDDVIYHAPGGDVTIKACVEYDMGLLPGHATDVFYNRVDIQFLKSAVAHEITRGTRFTHSGVILEAQQWLHDNNHYLRIVCKRISE